MKKIICMLLVVSTFTIIPSMPVEAAISPSRNIVTTGDFEEVYEFAEFGSSSAIKPCPAGTFKVRKNTRTKKKIVNSLIAGGIGTAIGAGVGGKRGALIGLGSGAGGYLVYRYVRDRRGRCVPRYVGRG